MGLVGLVYLHGSKCQECGKTAVGLIGVKAVQPSMLVRRCLLVTLARPNQLNRLKQVGGHFMLNPEALFAV